MILGYLSLKEKSSKTMPFLRKLFRSLEEISVSLTLVGKRGIGNFLCDDVPIMTYPVPKVSRKNVFMRI